MKNKIYPVMYGIGQFSYSGNSSRYPKCFIQPILVCKENIDNVRKGINKNIFQTEEEAFQIKEKVEKGEIRLQEDCELWLC